MLSILMLIYPAVWGTLLLTLVAGWFRVPFNEWGKLYFDPIWAVLMFFTVGLALMIYTIAFALYLLFDK